MVFIFLTCGDNMHKKKDCNCPACNPVIKPKAYEETPKPQLSLKERLAKQRLKNHMDSEATYARIMANGKEHAAHRAKVLAERGMAKTGYLDGITEGITDAAHYVGGITKTVGDTITSSVEAVINDPSMIKDTADNVASTLIDGVTYFPDAVLEEVAPELSYGAKDRTDQRISNAIDGSVDGLNGLSRDYEKHQQAIDSGDFETAGSVFGEHLSSVILPNKKLKPFTGTYKGNPIELKDIELVDINYKKRDRDEYLSLRKEFNNTIRSDFLKDLAKDKQAISILRQQNVTEPDIIKLMNGKVPQGYQVHHKIPLDDGGTNNKENLILIRNSPEHAAFTTYQKQQTSNLKNGDSVDLAWPIPNGNVYPKD